MLKIRKKLQSGTRGLLNPVILRAFGNRSNDLRDTLVIMGHYRSGTTWLGELVSTIPGAGTIFEPLQVSKNPGARTAGFVHRNYCHPDTDWPAGEAYLRDVLSGRVLTPWTTSNIPVGRALRVDRWVVKLIGLNPMMEWFLRRFDIPAPMLIIRHPCAILASMKSRGWSGFSKHVQADRYFRDTYPEFRDVLDGVADPIDMFAVRWCIDHWIPLTMAQPLPFHLVCYEQLLVSGPEVLEPAFADWGIELPQRLRDRFHRPSAKASETFSRDNREMLGKWRETLGEDEVRRVLAIVERFGLDFYTDAPEPDYERLMGASPVRRYRD